MVMTEVYSGTHAKPENAFCEQIVEYYNIDSDGT